MPRGTRRASQPIMRSSQQVIICVLLVLVCAWCAFHFREDWQQLSLSSKNHVVLSIALAAALSLANYAIRTLRWSFYLSRLGHRLTLRSAAITYVAGFAFAISPGKLGELARARYYTQAGTPVRDLAAMVLVERVMDVATMLILATLALYLFPDYARPIAVVAIVAAAGVAAMILVPWQALTARAQAPTKVSRSLRLLHSVSGAMSSARSLLNWHSVMIGLALGIVGWACEGVGLYFLSTMSLQSDLSVAAATGIYAVATIAGAATLLPGGLIGTEAAMAALLVSSGIPAGDALVITLLSRFTTLWFAVAIGWAAVFFLELRIRRTACT